MEFGGLLSLDHGVFSSPFASTYSEPDKGTSNNTTGTGTSSQFGSSSPASGFLKHGRSDHDDPGIDEEDDGWSRSLKLAKTSEAMSKAAPFLLRSSSQHHHHSLFPADGEQMLSFSSSASKPNAISSDGSTAAPFFQHNYYLPSSYCSSPNSSAAAAAAYYYRNAGIVSAGSTSVSMHGAVKGPFTPSQWVELEHQALIYKYLDAKAPIPSNLLIPFRRSVTPYGLSNYLTGSFRSSTLGWGSFHLGFSGSADPEPGRCRRTDGKKWRCSRDAVADQKYCERHMNRGRHRSRKLVEGRCGQAPKSVPAIATAQPASAGFTVSPTNGLPIAQQQTRSLQSNAIDPPPSQFNRILVSKENVNDHTSVSQGLSAMTDGNSASPCNLFPISKLHDPFKGTSTRPDSHLVRADSLLNPSRTSYSGNISFDSSSQLDDHQSQTHPLRHFIDHWPKNQSDRSTITWPEVDDMKSDGTQLSMSIPTNFSASSSSPNQEKAVFSPLRLSREFNAVNEENQRQTSWVPISWEPTVGGPLGEVLNNTSSTPKGLSKNCSSSSLNLLTDGWDLSPRLETSPTGVLQKTTFGSLSSSAGSSPRADNHKIHDNTSNLSDDLLGSTLVNPSTVPAL